MSNVTCSDCGEELEGVDTVPCPHCGSKRRHVALSARITAMASGRGTAVVIPFGDALLADANKLIEDGRFDLAVVVAHTACEISVEQAITHELSTKSLGYLKTF